MGKYCSSFFAPFCRDKKDLLSLIPPSLQVPKKTVLLPPLFTPFLACLSFPSPPPPPPPTALPPCSHHRLNPNPPQCRAPLLPPYRFALPAPAAAACSNPPSPPHLPPAAAAAGPVLRSFDGASGRATRARASRRRRGLRP